MKRSAALLIGITLLTGCSCSGRTVVFENRTADSIAVELWLGKSPYAWFTKTCAYRVEIAPDDRWSTATATQSERASFEVHSYWLDQFWVYHPSGASTADAAYRLEFNPNEYARSKVATIVIDEAGAGVAVAATNEIGTALELHPIEAGDPD